MQAGRRQSEQRVAGLDLLAGEKFLAVHDADNKACEVVFARRIEAGHFRGFATNERAARFAAGTAHAFDKLLDHLRLELAHREIVEEKQRLGALHEDVVDAVIDEVAADGGVHAHGHGHFEFRAHAIGAGDQHRLFPFLVVESKERAKAADAA